MSGCSHPSTENLTAAELADAAVLREAFGELQELQVGDVTIRYRSRSVRRFLPDFRVVSPAQGVK